jgi:hypothetical protein
MQKEETCNENNIVVSIRELEEISFNVGMLEIKKQQNKIKLANLEVILGKSDILDEEISVFMADRLTFTKIDAALNVQYDEYMVQREQINAKLAELVSVE